MLRQQRKHGTVRLRVIAYSVVQYTLHFFILPNLFLTLFFVRYDHA